jgi:hypothetical protein
MIFGLKCYLYSSVNKVIFIVRLSVTWFLNRDFQKSNHQNDILRFMRCGLKILPFICLRHVIFHTVFPKITHIHRHRRRKTLIITAHHEHTAQGSVLSTIIRPFYRPIVVRQSYDFDGVLSNVALFLYRTIWLYSKIA